MQKSNNVRRSYLINLKSNNLRVLISTYTFNTQTVFMHFDVI